MKRGTRQFLIWHIAYFLFVGIIVTVAVLAYIFLQNVQDGAIVAGVMFLVVFFLSTIVSVADYSRRVITVNRPVERILDGAERIARGDFSVRIPRRTSEGKYDSFDIIIDCMNRMAEELGKAEIFRTDFVANISHEIKTPLTVIGGYALALKDERDEAKRAEYTAAIVSATERLTSLVNDVLKLNKLEHQTSAEEKTRVELGESVREAVIAYEEIIEKKGLGLECDIDDVAVLSCPSYLSMVWNNLLSNAVKFTPSGGTVFVSVHAEERGATVEIRDTGCGISPETGSHIFDKFYQGETSHAGEGNGLGLALVKEVIDLLGGEIDVRSVVGEGSTFTVRLEGLV